MRNDGRFHGLDAVRACALLLGICLHASVSFVPVTLGWAVQDRSVSWAAYLLGFHYTHMFRMTTFFLMAGFFGRLLYVRRGPDAFVRDRFRRIVVPLVCGWVVFYPLIRLVWLWGAGVSGKLPVEKAGQPLWRLTLDGFTTGSTFDGGVPLAHLWFLYYLALLYGLVLLARPVLGSLQAHADSLIRMVFSRALGPAALAVPIALAVYLTRTPGGIQTPERGLIPDVKVLLAYGTMFAAGWLLHRQPELLPNLARRALPYAAAGLVLGTLALAIMMGARVAPGQPMIEAKARNFAAVYGLATVFLTFGFVGVFLRGLDRPIPAVRYLSDASYWMYIAHLPLVVALQVLVSRWPLHWSLKWLLVTAVATALLLLSYRYLVRYTFIGHALNGPRTRSENREADQFAAA
jgi:glucans biosynthesis protein C